jgi:hypothetical protein
MRVSRQHLRQGSPSSTACTPGAGAQPQARDEREQSKGSQLERAGPADSAGHRPDRERVAHDSPESAPLGGFDCHFEWHHRDSLFPLHATAYFATADGAQALDNPWVSAWSGAFRRFADPLLTFAPADAVYTAYGKVAPIILLGFLAGLIALHGHQANAADGVERWGFRIALAGNLLTAAGAFGEYYTSALSFSFLYLSLPGILIYMIGISLFGIGTLRAGTTPRLGAWLLILGGFPGIPLLTYFVVGHFSGGLLLLDIAWIVLGHALWSGGRAAVDALQPAPDRV